MGRMLVVVLRGCAPAMRRFALFAADLISGHPFAIIAGAMAVAIALSFGIPRLHFRTGQDTLLDAHSKIALDNTRYQRQFGGDAMLVLFEAPPDGSISALFSAQNREQLARADDELTATGNYESVITPLTVLEFAQQTIERRITSEPEKLARDETAASDAARAASRVRGESPAQQDIAAAAAKQQTDDAFNRDFGADAQRFVAIEGEHTLDNPAFLDFVLYDSAGAIRPDFAGIFPDDRHALMVVRARGNLSIDEGARVAAHVQT